MTAVPQSLHVVPWDVHNEALVANVRPADWVNPEPASRYNLVVIGAGTAGLVIAVGAAGLGARVALDRGVGSRRRGSRCALWWEGGPAVSEPTWLSKR